MAFTKLTGTGKTTGLVDYVSDLPDDPNDSGGLDADGLKAVFDQAGKEIQAYLNNTLTAELESSTGGASIGVSAAGVTATKLNAALEELKTAVDQATIGTLPNGSVTTAKIQDGAVSSAKLGASPVTTEKIADGAVTGAKLGAKAVGTANIDDGAVDTAQIADGAITSNKLGTNEAVKTSNLTADFVLPAGKGGTGTTNGAQAPINTAVVTLIGGTTDAWTQDGAVYTQDAAITGMLATSKFVASPADPSSWDLAMDANLKPPTAGADKLTFVCDECPAGGKDISVTVYWW